jgi:hypothetical protein
MNNAGEAGDAPLAAKWQLAALVKERAPLVRKSAVYGMTGARRLVVGALLRASGRSDRVRICASRDEAERYLLS